MANVWVIVAGVGLLLIIVGILGKFITKKWTWWIWALIILGILLLIGGIAMYFTTRGKSSAELKNAARNYFLPVEATSSK